eukprot:477829-Amphidinium_carterae.1
MVAELVRLCIWVKNNHVVFKTQSEQISSELDKENDKTVSANGNPQTLTETYNNEHFDNKNK